jgi:hypothetical protein
MPSMTRHPGGSELAWRVAALEAERLAPVPRAAHAVGVDAADLALVLDCLRASAAGPRGTNIAAAVMGSETAAAYWRLDAAIRAHAATRTGPAVGPRPENQP